MASSFSNKKSSSSKDDAKVVAALTPKPFSSPYGSFNKNTYTPTESADQRSAREGSDAAISGLIGNVPTSFTIDEAFDNPYYDTLKGHLDRNTNTMREEQQKALQDKLSARNQLGSSYDAYSNYLMDKDFNNQYANNESSARLGATDVYNQQVQNLLNSLGTIQNVNSQQYNRYYQPLAYALNAQQANTPYQTAQANYFASNLAQANQARSAANPLMSVFPALMAAL